MENQAVANESVHDRLDVSATRLVENPTFTILNGLLSGLWRAYVQHQTHVALIEAQGLQSLADAIRVRTADEPKASARRSRRHTRPRHGAPAIGATVREFLDNDMALQRHTRPKFNAAAEATAAAS
jgi:bacterioferritin